MLSEQIAVTLLVVDALQSYGVPYLISGSLASGVHGRMRATMDAHLVADLRLEQAEALALALGDAFYMDREMILQAIRQHGSFNDINLETTFMVDIFISKGRPFDHRQLERRVAQVVSR